MHANFLRCRGRTGATAIQQSARPGLGSDCAGLPRNLIATDAAITAMHHRRWPPGFVWALCQRCVPRYSHPSGSGVCRPVSFPGRARSRESCLGARRFRGEVDPNGVIYAAGGRGDDGLLDPGLEKRFRVNHGNEEFVKGLGTSTVSRLFGAMPDAGWRSATAFKGTGSGCLSRKLPSASSPTSLIPTGHCLNCSESILYGG